MNFLPDTNVLIRYYKGIEPDKQFLIKLISEDKLFLSVVSIAEFLVGIQKKEKKYLDELCNIADVIAINREIAETVAVYRRKFSQKSKKVYLLDCFLAASCKMVQATLVTNNISDYPMKDIKVIKPK